MKIIAGDKEVCVISETQKKIIADDVAANVEADIMRRIKWVIDHKVEHQLGKLKAQWLPRLKERGVDAIPLDDMKLAELIFSQPDYKDAQARSAERE